MCLQCCTECVTLKDSPLTGYYLARSVKQYDDILPGDWMLGRINDPDFIWTVTPAIDPFGHLNADEIDDVPDESDKWEQEEKFRTAAAMFGESLDCRPNVGHQLVMACCETGYRGVGDDGDVKFWLFDHLARHIAEHNVWLVDVSVDVDDIQVPASGQYDADNNTLTVLEDIGDAFRSQAIPAMYAKLIAAKIR